MKTFFLFGLLAAAGLVAQTTPFPPAPAAAGPNQEMISPDTIQFPNNPVSDFLMVYERLKGVTLIKDASLAAGGPNLSLTLNQPVSKEEAIRLIESTLLLNGYAFIAVDKKTVKVINTAGGKNPRSEGVFVFTSEEELPEGEVIASFVMPLTHLAAADAVEIFNQFIVLHPYGSMVAVPVANQVVITENSTLIRRLLEVKALVDQPAPEVRSEFVQLQQANADRVVELITQLLEKREEGAGATAGRAATGQPTPPPGVPPIPGVQAAAATTAANINAGSLGDIQLIADTRTNRILIVTRPMNMDYIKKLIEEFDVAVDLSEPYEQPLNYVAASDMLPVLADMLQEEGLEGAAGAAGTGAPGRTVTGGIGTGAAAAAGTGAGVSGAGQLGSLQEPGEQQAAQSVIVGKTRLIADNRANSILVIGQPEARDKVKSILDKLDKRPMQVFLATVIGSLTISNNDEFSFNILQRYSKTGASSGINTVAGGTNITTGAPLSQAAASFSQLATLASNALPGMQIAAFVGNTLDLYLQALTATSRFRIASRPSVFTANNKKAVIFNGKKIAVPTGTVTSLVSGDTATSNTGSLTSNIQYQDVVLKIEVVPLINSAREVSLQIIQTNDTVLNSSTNIGGGVEVPEISTQELTTTVTVPDRSTILIGGLITQTDQKNTSGVPFLSAVPLLGNLFKSTTDLTDRQELVVLIQPSVVNDVPELREVSKTERDLTGFSSKELAPLSMKVGSKTSAQNTLPLSSPEGLPEPPTQE
jgi:general secretion pathway protein D